MLKGNGNEACATEPIFCCPTENSLISIKRSAVQRGERFNKKNGEMSYNFGEIIKKLYSLFQEAKPSRHSRLPPPSSQVATADFPRGGEKCASCRRRFHSQIYSWDGGGRAGWSANQRHSITDHRIGLQFNMKMDNGVLLLCYLDKICLTLTGDFWRALASLYSEARLYKGPRACD
jgi:hypothetical protein